MESAICSAPLPFVVHMAVGMKHVQHALLLDGLLTDSHIIAKWMTSLNCLIYLFFILPSPLFSALSELDYIHFYSLNCSLPPFLSFPVRPFEGWCQLQPLPFICPVVVFVFQSSPMISLSFISFSLSCLFSISCIHKQPAMCLVTYSAFFFFLHVLSFSMCSSASCIEMRWAFCLLLCSLSICFAVMHSIDSQNSLAGTVCSVGVCICIFIFGVEVRSCSALSVREWNCWCIRERVTRGKS